MEGVRKAIAIDFDGCLCTDAYPEIGEPNWPVIRQAQAEQRAGAGLILWTCREGDLLQKAVAACEGWGLTFDAVNESLPDWIEAYGNSPRKIGASEYWDDKAITMPKGQEFFTLDQAAELLCAAFGDECPCNYNGIDEWLRMVCQYCECSDCPDPPNKIDCWKEYIKKRGGAKEPG